MGCGRRKKVPSVLTETTTDCKSRRITATNSDRPPAEPIRRSGDRAIGQSAEQAGWVVPGKRENGDANANAPNVGPSGRFDHRRTWPDRLRADPATVHLAATAASADADATDDRGQPGQRQGHRQPMLEQRLPARAGRGDAGAGRGDQRADQSAWQPGHVRWPASGLARGTGPRAGSSAGERGVGPGSDGTAGRLEIDRGGVAGRRQADGRIERGPGRRVAVGQRG